MPIHLCTHLFIPSKENITKNLLISGNFRRVLNSQEENTQIRDKTQEQTLYTWKNSDNVSMCVCWHIFYVLKRG